MKSAKENKDQFAKFRRFEILSSEPIPFDPPAGLINPDYKHQTSNTRKCVECGKWHDTIVEDAVSGERLDEINQCMDCLLNAVD